MWFSAPAFAVLLGFVVLPWVLIAFGLLSKPSLGTSAPGSVEQAESAPSKERRAGVWGELELIRITTFPSEELIPEGWSRQLEVSWFFPAHTAESLRQFIDGLDLTTKQRADLLNEETWTIEEDGVAIRPDSDTILSLAPTVRGAIYAVLARTPRNVPHQVPWSILTDDFEPVLAASGLSAETEGAVRSVAFRRGRRTCISDGFTVLNIAASRDEKLRASRLLSSASTYLVKLRVPKDADIEDLVNYWCGRGRRKDLRPMFEALAALPEGGTLDAAHLLPAFGRQRLYIYPHPSQANDGVSRDCHWTSLNFFSLTPDDRFGVSEQAQRYILEQYYRINETPRFGDLVFFSSPDGGIIHSCVYLAANLVFTKNGVSIFQPWSIMDLDDLAELYSFLSPDGLETQYWRNRQQEQ